MRQTLCTLLARHAGETITQELAVEMVRELFPDRSYDPSLCAPQEYKGYVFRLERLADIRDELHPLHEAHYAETELYRAGLALNMNYELLEEREHAGGLLQFTSRTANGELAGQMRVYLSQSVHTQTLIATEDVFYVKPEHRGGFMAVRLWQYADRFGEQIGVTETYFSSKKVNNAGSLAKYLKYTHYGDQYCKVRKVNIPNPPAQEREESQENCHVLT